MINKQQYMQISITNKMLVVCSNLHNMQTKFN